MERNEEKINTFEKDDIQVSRMIRTPRIDDNLITILHKGVHISMPERWFFQVCNWMKNTSPYLKD